MTGEQIQIPIAKAVVDLATSNRAEISVRQVQDQITGDRRHLALEEVAEEKIRLVRMILTAQRDHLASLPGGVMPKKSGMFSYENSLLMSPLQPNKERYIL